MRLNVIKSVTVCALLNFVLQSEALEVQSKDFDMDNNLDYVITTKYYTAIMVNPKVKSSAQPGQEICKGGWFRDIILKESDKGILQSEGMQFGLTQIFTPPIFYDQENKNNESDKAKEEEKLDNKSQATSNNQQWQSSVEKKDNDVIISFSQDVQINKDKSYKLRIDTRFSDNAKISVRGILFNTGKQAISTSVSPRPFFSFNPSGSPCWISIPLRKSFNFADKKFMTINSDPINPEKMAGYTEYNDDRFSKSERWIAAGGMNGDNVFAFLTKNSIDKIVFWKDHDSFGIAPSIKLDVLPEQRTEWEWVLFFGKGLDRVSKVTDNGIYAVKSALESVTVEYLPYKSIDSMVLDLTVNTPEGKMIFNRSKDFINFSPLQPGTAKLQIPNELRGKRYLMKLDFLVDDNPVEQFSHWLNTLAELTPATATTSSTLPRKTEDEPKAVTTMPEKQ